MTENWLKAINYGKIVGTVIVDFRKAFDLVDHELLLQKLKLYRCSNNFMKYTEIFKVVKNEDIQKKMFDIFLIFAVLTSTHNLCFGAKIRQIGIPLHTPPLLYKSVV